LYSSNLGRERCLPEASQGAERQKASAVAAQKQRRPRGGRQGPVGAAEAPANPRFRGFQRRDAEEVFRFGVGHRDQQSHRGGMEKRDARYLLGATTSSITNYSINIIIKHTV
jgi:hypothetical protein